MIWATVHYGAIGAAWMGIILNAAYILIGVHFMYRRILSTEKWKWYGKDMILPMLAAIVIMWLCMLVQPSVDNKLPWLIWLAITGILMVIGAWLVSPDLSVRKT
jgi:uncharacterized membrane protein YgdD (TMEM256/DUF423 family)